MYYLFVIMILAHLIADFYLQTNDMVKGKSFKNGWAKEFLLSHFKHGAIHYLLWGIAGFLFLYTTRADYQPKIYNILKVGLVVVALHMLIDVAKEWVLVKKGINKFLCFLLDQVMHVLIIILGVIVLSKYCGFVVTPKQLNTITPILYALTILVGAMLLLKPASIMVMLFLDLSMSDGAVKKINITRSHLAKIFDEKFSLEIGSLVNKVGLNEADIEVKMNLFKENTDKIAKKLVDNKEYLKVDVSGIFPTNNAGKWIGYIERLMIYIFYLCGQYTAIAAVMAIKTAFRFNDLKDDNDSQRSEYIMLGTFFSLFVTIVIAVCVKHFMDVNSFKEIIIIFKKTFM